VAGKKKTRTPAGAGSKLKKKNKKNEKRPSFAAWEETGGREANVLKTVDITGRGSLIFDLTEEKKKGGSSRRRTPEPRRVPDEREGFPLSVEVQGEESRLWPAGPFAGGGEKNASLRKEKRNGGTRLSIPAA